MVTTRMALQGAWRAGTGAGGDNTHRGGTDGCRWCDGIHDLRSRCASVALGRATHWLLLSAMYRDFLRYGSAKRVATETWHDCALMLDGLPMADTAKFLLDIAAAWWVEAAHADSQTYAPVRRKRNRCRRVKLCCLGKGVVSCPSRCARNPCNGVHFVTQVDHSHGITVRIRDIDEPACVDDAAHRCI